MTVVLVLFYLVTAYGLLALRSPGGLIRIHELKNKTIRSCLEFSPEALASLSYVICLSYGGMALSAWGEASLGPSVLVWATSLSYHLAWIHFFTNALNLGGIRAKPILWRFMIAQMVLGSWILFKMWRLFHPLAETTLLTF